MAKKLSEQPLLVIGAATAAFLVLVAVLRHPSAADQQKDNDARSIIHAEGVVKDQLKDGDSARFRDERVVRSVAGKAVCGEVDGKNSFGGREGFQRFISLADGAEFEEASAGFDEDWQTRCARQYQ